MAFISHPRYSRMNKGLTGPLFSLPREPQQTKKETRTYSGFPVYDCLNSDGVWPVYFLKISLK